jgi:urea transporter
MQLLLLLIRATLIKFSELEIKISLYDRLNGILIVVALNFLLRSTPKDVN